VPIPAVEARHLAKRYGAVDALVDVSFDAPAGGITAILGRNGAGKTTAVEICAGLRKPDTGTSRVLGLDPRRDATAVHRQVAVMPQTGGSGAAGIYPSARPREVLALFASFYADPYDAEELLDRFGLANVASTPWRRLSGGEQQRLSLALALVGRPRLVFLDEPTAGMDVHARHETLVLIAELRTAGTSIVLTTHALDEAQRLADHVVVIDHGCVIAAGSPTELLATAGPATLSFDAPPALPLDDLAQTLPAGTTVAEATPGHYVVTGAVDPALAAAVTAWCAARGVLPERLSTVDRSLEDLFVQLTADTPA
jgi:ABC-2 type transport system ATP-binding protein